MTRSRGELEEIALRVTRAVAKACKGSSIQPRRCLINIGLSWIGLGSHRKGHWLVWGKSQIWGLMGWEVVWRRFLGPVAGWPVPTGLVWQVLRARWTGGTLWGLLAGVLLFVLFICLRVILGYTCFANLECVFGLRVGGSWVYIGQVRQLQPFSLL